MSTKATNISRTARKAVASTRRKRDVAKAASRAARCAREAIDAAAVASCAAERASIAVGKPVEGTASVFDLARQAEAAASEAVERARHAIEAESEGDVTGALVAANLSARAAQRASSLSGAVNVLLGKDRALASSEGPAALPSEANSAPDTSEKELMEQRLAQAIDEGARYLLTYDARIIATFAHEEDAFLLESELGDLDRQRGVRSARCEVIDRKTGHRLGGYLIAGDNTMLMFVRDDDHEKRFGKARR